MPPRSSHIVRCVLVVCVAATLAALAQAQIVTSLLTIPLSSDFDLGLPPIVATPGSIIFDGGTVEITASFTLNSNRGISVTANGGTIQTDPGTTLSFGGDVDGAGRLTKSGTGTLIYTGSDSHTGGTTIAAGTLQLGNGGSGGSISDTGGIIDNGTLVFDSSDFVTYGGQISGSGSVVYQAPLTLTLTGANTYSGGTTISNGGRITALNTSGSATGSGTINLSGEGSELFVGNGGTAGAVSGDIMLGSGFGDVTFNRSDDFSYSGVISGGSGFSVSKEGAGKLTLLGQSTYSGTTYVLGGTLSVGVTNALPVASQIVVFNDSGNPGVPTVLELAADQTISVITMDDTAEVSVDANKTLTFDTDGSQAISGILAGAGALKKTGTGDLFLDGANTYSGGTTIDGGRLFVDGDSRLGTAPAIPTPGSLTFDDGTLTTTASFTLNANRGIALNSGGGTFETYSDATLSYGGIIAGAGALTKTGDGALALSGANTYSGGTTINAGTLSAANSTGSATGPGDVTVNFGTFSIGSFGTSGSIAGNVILNDAFNAYLQFARSDPFTYAGVISGSGTVYNAGTGTVTLNGTNTFSGALLVQSGVVADGKAGAYSPNSVVDPKNGAELQVNFDETVAGLAGNGIPSLDGLVTISDGATLTIADGGYYYAFAGVIAGGGALVKSGTGGITLTGANTYAGGTTIDGGTIIVGNASGSATGSSQVTINSGTLQIGLLSGVTTTGAIAGDVVLNDGDNAILQFVRTDDYTYAGAISGVGRVAKNSAGTLTLSGANTFSGSVYVDQGTLADGAAGAFSPNSLIELNSSLAAGLAVNYNETVPGVEDSFGSDATITIADHATLTLALPAEKFLAIGGVISGAGSLAKSGLGTQELSGANTYSGGTTINAGTLLVTNTTGSGTGSGTVTINGGELDVGFGGASGAVSGDIVNNALVAFNRYDDSTYAGAISGSGVVTKQGAGFLTLTGTNTYSGGTTISSGYFQLGNGGTTGSIVGNVTLAGYDGAGGGELRFNHSDDVTFVGVISGTGRVSTFGSGSVTLAGANTYSGGTYVAGGTLQDGAAGTFSPNSIIFVDQCASLGVGFDETIGGLNDYAPNKGGPVTLANGTTLTIQANFASAAFSGTIGGGGAIEKTGFASQELDGANTYTGGTTVSEGSLVLNNSSGSATGTGSVTVEANGTLAVGTGGTSGILSSDVANGGFVNFNRSDDVNYGGVISGIGEVSQQGTGKLTLSGANTYSGITVIDSGKLADGATGAYSPNSFFVVENEGAALEVNFNETVDGLGGAGTVCIANQKNLTISSSSDFSFFDGTISGGGGLVKSGTGGLELSGANTYSGGTVINGGTVIAANTSGSATGSGSVTINSGVLEIGDFSTSGAIAGNIILNDSENAALYFEQAAGCYTYAGIISGTGTVFKFDAGTLKLTGANTYTGTTFVDDGTLADGAAHAFSPNSIVSLEPSDQATLEVNFDETIAGLQSFEANSLVTLAENATLTVANASSDYFGAPISGAGALAKTAAGSLTLAGANTYAGGTTISGGALVAANLNLTDSATGTGNIKINATGTLKIGDGGADGSVSGNITDDGSLAFNRSDSILVYAGTISGAGNVANLGIGTITLTGANTYGGGTTIQNGRIIVANTTGSALGSGDVTVSGNGALEIGGGVAAGTIAGNVNLNSTGASIYFSRPDNFTFNNAISGGGYMIKDGAGKLTLAGANTYGGEPGPFSDATIVLNGTLADATAGTFSPNSWLNVQDEAAVQVHYDETTAGLTGAVGTTVTIASGATLTVNYPLDVFAGTISGQGSFQVIGLGFERLQGANIYSGGTTVTGTLIAANTTGSATGTGTVTVNSGGVLGGRGTITGPLVLNNGATVAPGLEAAFSSTTMGETSPTPPGMLHVGDTTFGGGAAFNFRIDSATGPAGESMDLLAISGALTIGADSGNPFVVRLNSLTFADTAGPLLNFDSAQPYSWMFVSTTGGVSGFSAAAFSVNTDGFMNSFEGSFGVSLSGNNLFLQYSPAAVPEPATWMLMMAGLGVLILCARRRVKAGAG